ncbi:hypothetical protein Tco_0653086 [Tanacetum coccineum]|uniref:Uncharacterized protein n=1 Tax=Tanacetum coccineum TaxID=301880 RepID=A0ABQ4WZF1_9ASTR
MTKVEFPKFSGNDVKGWIFRWKQFFSIDEIHDNKVKLICVHLFDIALLWHRQFIRLNGENLSRVDVSEEHAVSLYLGGLPIEIKMGVRMFKPSTLAEEATLDAVKKKNGSKSDAIEVNVFGRRDVVETRKDAEEDDG